MKKFILIILIISGVFYSYAVELINIKGGEFTREVLVWEKKCTQKIKVSNFKIAESKVTVKEYKMFLSSKAKKLPKIMINDFYSEVPDNIPIYGITFFEAAEYCNWLSEKENLCICYKIVGEKIDWDYTANGYRLPTEAEWEYAASGAWKDKEILSDDIEVVKKYLKCISAYAYKHDDFLPHEVMKYKKNKFGLYDVLDNCAEWCWDLFNVDYYDISTPLEDSKGPNEGYDEMFYKIYTTNRVNKGTWYQSEDNFSNPIKEVYSIWPTQNSSYISIRLARNAE